MVRSISEKEKKVGDRYEKVYEDPSKQMHAYCVHIKSPCTLGSCESTYASETGSGEFKCDFAVGRAMPFPAHHLLESHQLQSSDAAFKNVYRVRTTFNHILISAS